MKCIHFQAKTFVGSLLDEYYKNGKSSIFPSELDNRVHNKENEVHVGLHLTHSLEMVDLFDQ